MKPIALAAESVRSVMCLSRLALWRPIVTAVSLTQPAHRVLGHEARPETAHCRQKPSKCARPAEHR
jgi:hypothetical protein